MIIDPSELDRRGSYRFFSSIIIPRPIAWVTTLNEDGSANAAPFSFFMGVTSHPPRLAFSASRRRNEKKDTILNIMRTKEFAVNLVTEDNAEAMNVTSGDYRYGVDELKLAGLSASGAEKVSAPLIGESPVNMECTLERIIEIGDPASSVVFGRVVLFHVSDDIMGDGFVDPHKVNAVGRLGVPNYNRVNDIFEMGRPKID